MTYEDPMVMEIEDRQADAPDIESVSDSCWPHMLAVITPETLQCEECLGFLPFKEMRTIARNLVAVHGSGAKEEWRKLREARAALRQNLYEKLRLLRYTYWDEGTYIGSTSFYEKR